MAVKRIWTDGQSNSIRLHAPAYGEPFLLNAIPMLQALMDPTEAEVTVSRLYNGTDSPVGTLAFPSQTGTGRIFDNNAMTLNGDGYYEYTDGDYFVRPPAAIDETRMADWANWPISTRGQAVLDWATANVSPADKATVSAILVFHSEYDSQGYGVNAAWTLRDPRLLANGYRRWHAQVRSVLGKTAAELPAYFVTTIPFASGGNAGFEACRAAFELLAADPAHNAKVLPVQTMDCNWDGDTPGTYSSHATNAEVLLLSRRIALALARELGPIWAPNSYRQYTNAAMRPVWARWIDSTTVDVTVSHDGGSDFTLQTTPTLGWRVTYAGAPVTVSTVAKQDARTLRLTLATASAVPELLRVHYVWGNTRLLFGGGTYDNTTSLVPDRAYPAGITGANRIAGALVSTPAAGLRVGAAAPPAYIVTPIAA